MGRIILYFSTFIVVLFLGMILFYLFGREIWLPYIKKHLITTEKREVNDSSLPPPSPTPFVADCKMDDEVEEREDLTSEQRLNRYLADKGFVIYPKRLTLIGIKHEKILEVWGELKDRWVLLTKYPFTGYSGNLGPKYREGDRQIPEGIYRISYLNPNSKYHLSMRVNYPNEFDKKMAKNENRTNLGGDIMIHGSDVTVGCIPIGNDRIEELYFLAEKVGINNIKVILSPVDFRKMKVRIKKNRHPWLRTLYRNINEEMKNYK